MPPTLVITDIFPPRHGGSGRWFYELYRRLPREGFRIVAGLAHGHEAFDRVHAGELSVLRLPLSTPDWSLRSLSGLRFYARSYRSLSRIVSGEGIAAIHCARCLPEGVIGYLFSRLRGLPFLCYVHGEDVQAASQSREHTWMVRQIFRRAQRIVANSENSAALLRNEWQVPAAKVAVLHPGMDASRFAPAPRDDTFLGEMGWKDRKVILSVGRLQKRKGHDMMIRALPLLLESHPDVLYSIIGDGEEKEPLTELVKALGVEQNVQFLGSCDDGHMIRCYQQCTLFALPNRTEGKDIEGFGMVLVEAQACGKPVLAGDSGGTRETMVPGTTGVLVDCTAPESIARAVAGLLGKPAQELEAMGKRGREHACQHFDWPVHVARAQTLMDELLTENHGHARRH